jgi:hypothetical protein
MLLQIQPTDAGDTSNSDSGFCCYPRLLFFTAVMLDFEGDFPKHYQQLVGGYAVIE